MEDERNDEDEENKKDVNNNLPATKSGDVALYL